METETLIREERDAPLRGRLAVRVAEAARLLDIGRSKAYELIRTGEIPSIRVGKTVRIPLAALEMWVAAQQAAKEKT